MCFKQTYPKLCQVAKKTALASVNLMILVLSDLSFARSLNLDQVLKIAESQSIDRQLLDLSSQITNSDRSILLSGIFPQLKFNLSSMRLGQPGSGSQYAMIENPPDTVYSSRYDWQLQLAAPVYAFGRTKALLDAYLGQGRLIGSQFDANMEAFLASVVRRYLGLYQSMQHVIHQQSVYEYAASLLQYVKMEYQKNALNKIDYLRSKSLHSQSKAMLDLARSEEKKQKIDLGIILFQDISSEFDLDLSIDLSSSFFEVDKSKSLESKALKAQREALEVQSHLKDHRQAQYYPSISLISTIGNSQSNNPLLDLNHNLSDLQDHSNLSYQVGLSFDWQLFDGLQTTHQYYKAVSELSKSKISYQKNVLSHGVSINQIEEKIIALRLLVTSNQDSEEAEKLAFKKIGQDFKDGAATTAMVLDAETKWSEAHARLVGSYVDLIMATVEYKQTLGLPIGS